MDIKVYCAGVLLVWASLCSVATPDPVRQLRYPRIYNAYITTNKQLQPSKAYPHSAPVLQPALYGPAHQPSLYGPAHQPALFGPGVYPAPALYAPSDAVPLASRDVEQRQQDGGQEAELVSEAGEVQSPGQEEEFQKQQQEPLGQEQEPLGQEQETQGKEQEQEQEPLGQEQESLGQEQETQGQEQETQGQEQESLGQEQETQGQEQETQEQEKEAQLQEEQQQTLENETQRPETEPQRPEVEPKSTKNLETPAVNNTDEEIQLSSRMAIPFVHPPPPPPLPPARLMNLPKPVVRQNYPLTFYPRSVGYYPHPFIPYSYPLAPQPFVFGGVAPGLGAPNAIYNYPTQVAGNYHPGYPSSQHPITFKSSQRSTIEINSGRMTSTQQLYEGINNGDTSNENSEANNNNNNKDYQ